HLRPQHELISIVRFVARADPRGPPEPLASSELGAGRLVAPEDEPQVPFERIAGVEAHPVDEALEAGGAGEELLVPAEAHGPDAEAELALALPDALADDGGGAQRAGGGALAEAERAVVGEAHPAAGELLDLG